jgi:hypothetical protein
MTDDITLPPLPPHRLGERWPHHVVWGYEDMVAFARAAVLLDRQQRSPSAEPVAWLDEAVNCAYSRAELDLGSEVGLVPLYTTPPDHREAMQQGLEALEERYIGALRDNAIDALRAALGAKRC